jgi:hypothetical protein
MAIIPASGADIRGCEIITCTDCTGFFSPGEAVGSVDTQQYQRVPPTKPDGKKTSKMYRLLFHSS